MFSKETVQKIRQIEIKSRYLASELFSGEYKSAFRGQGMEFEEVREYQPGDEIRLIDWNVTARMGHPYIKVFREERELSVLFVMDASGSQDFGSRLKLKKEMAAEIAALLATAAIRSHDKVGVLIFTDRVERYLPPKKGKAHVWQVIREILTFEPVHRQTSFKPVFQFLAQALPRETVCFLLSDFMAELPEKELKIVSQRHDLISLILADQLEKEFPPVGWVHLQSSETGEEEWVNFRSKNSFETIKNSQENWKNRFFSLSIDFCELLTDQDYVHLLLELFHKREKRIGRKK